MAGHHPPDRNTVFALFVDNRETGHTTVLTFTSAFDRALHVVSLGRLNVVLQLKDYTT